MAYDGQFKVTITHLPKGAATSTDYICRVFSSIKVTWRENDVSTAILHGDNLHSTLYPDNVNKFDTIKVYVKQSTASAWTEIFDGYIRDCNPIVDASGSLVELKCKGLGSALIATNCNTNYGYTSANDSIDTIEEIIEDLVDNYINKSFGTANNTGYSIGKDYVQAIDAGLSIPFINSPYSTNKEVIDKILMLDTAYRNGATAGPHWFVDVSGNLRVKTIGTQQAHGGFGGGDWGIYYGGSNTAITLSEGVDFMSYKVTTATKEYANNIVLIAKLRKPAYDYWTEDSGGQALWGSVGLTSKTDVNAAGPPQEYVVGSHSLELNITNPDTTGRAWYPSAESAGWDVTKWGSEESVPAIKFYFMKTADLQEASCSVRLCTTDHDNDYFYAVFSTWTDPDDEWIHRSIPIGPYWWQRGVDHY
jgi:hypothetical protein